MKHADIFSRIDALKRRCTTGYGCGSTCISPLKECRTRPGSAIGKERLKRLMALAAMGASRQQGAPTSAQAQSLSDRLRAARATRAQELWAQRQSAKSSKTPALSQALLATIDANNHELGGQQDTRPQSMVYEERGYNGKPEIIATRRELQSRKDLIRDSNGRVVVLCRGVENDDGQNYLQDFREGDVHRVGFGQHGNGTYAASGSQAHSIAMEYTKLGNPGWARERYGSELNNKVNETMMAFGIKKDANVVQCSTMEDFERFEAETMRKATDIIRAAGNVNGQVGDLGLAASILGIDAYSLPAPSYYRSSNRYWVILNRSAVVVARDFQWK